MGFSSQLHRALRAVACDLQGNGVGAGLIGSAIGTAITGEADHQIETAVSRIRHQADHFRAACTQGILPGFDPHTADAPAGRFARSATLRKRPVPAPAGLATYGEYLANGPNRDGPPAPAPASHCVQCGGRFGFGSDNCRCPFPAPAPAPAPASPVDDWGGPVS